MPCNDHIIVGEVVQNTTSFDKDCHWLEAGQLFSLGNPDFPTNRINFNHVSKILVKMVFKTHNPIQSGLIPPPMCACPNPRPGFPVPYVVVFFVCLVG